MAAAFLLRIPKRPGPPRPPALIATPSDLGFEPAEVAQWHGPAGRTHLQFWADASAEGGEGLRADDLSATFAVGDPHLGTSDEDAGRGLLQRIGSDPSPRALQAELRGTYVAGHLAAGGTGWVMADPLGMRCLYVGEDATQLVVGSRAALVAAGLRPPGTRARRDLAAVTWLAHTTFWSGTQTGYVGVRTAPPGQYLELGPAGPRWVPGFLAASLSCSVGEVPAATVAPQVVEDVAAGLDAVLRRPGDRHVLQLTGGRDSRMLLAVALHAGIAHRFHYQTAGPPGLADVRIASALAGRYGLSHEALFVGMRSTEPYGVEQRRWVRGVGGMVSAWEAPGRSMPDQRVTGVGGEFLRSFRKLPPGSGPEGVSAVLAGTRFGRLGLVRPEIAAAHRGVLEASVWPGDGVRSAHLEVHLYYALNRMRFTRLGPRLEVLAERRSYPLYSPVLVAEALRVDPEERESDLLCLEVLRRCAPELIELEFAGSSWDDRARRAIGHGLQVDRPVAPPVQPQPAPSAPVAPVAPGSQSLVENLFAAQTDERADFVREVLADEEDQIWEVLHRPRTVDAANRWSTLDLVERRELFGAVSAAIWASGRPEPGA